MKCIVEGCRRQRLAPRNGITFATCEAHTRIQMDPRPEWLRRADFRHKDYTGSAA